MLVAGVVDNKVEYEFHIPLVQLVAQNLDIGDMTIGGIYDFVVADIVPLNWGE